MLKFKEKFTQNTYVEYCQNINTPLIARVDWSKPMFSWLIWRYNGFIVKRDLATQVLLFFRINKDGYSFQSKNGTCHWTNLAYHDVSAFGLPDGILTDTEDRKIAVARRSICTKPHSITDLISYDLFDIIINGNTYNLKLEIEKHFSVIKGNVHLRMYENDILLFNTSKNGYYNEIFILNDIEYLSVLFPVFCSFFLNLSWVDL